MSVKVTGIAVYNASHVTGELSQALLATITAIHPRPWLVTSATSLDWSDEILYIIVCPATENTMPLPKHYIVYQLEPTVVLERPAYQQLLRGAQAVWDYSLHNVTYLAQCGITAIHVPVGYHPSTSTEDIISGQRSYSDAEKDVDVLFLGYDVHPRRKTIKEQLYLKGLRIWFVCGMGLTEMQAAIKRAKICLNIHALDGMSCLETVRLSVLLSNQACVLSEDFAELKDDTIAQYSSSVLFTSYDSLVDRCVELTNNFDLRRQMAHQGYQWYLQRTWSKIVPFNELLPNLSPPSDPDSTGSAKLL